MDQILIPNQIRTSSFIIYQTDVNLIIQYTKIQNRGAATAALTKFDGDIVDAIVFLLKFM